MFEIMNEAQICEQLSQMSPPRLMKLIYKLGLRDEYISNVLRVQTAIVAVEICKETKLVYREAWESEITKALREELAGARGYFEEKLGHIKDFLVEPPEPVNVSPKHKGTIKELREALKKLSKLEDPTLIRVKGTLFPAALLTEGWWERVHARGFDITWRDKDGLQQWCFEGFDAWAPSWDISWDLEGREQSAKPYYVAQLAMGDEADSLPVVLEPKIAEVWRNKFISGWKRKMWCGLEVQVTGVLGHKSQAKKHLPEVGQMSGFEENKANDYCIWLKDDEKKHDVERVGDTALYSGYLWKCLIPRKWIEEEDSIGLGDVYMVWEHTNFAARDALRYNLASLQYKESFIEDKHRKDGGLVLLQKSHDIIIPGDNPRWRAEDFYKLLVEGKRVKVSDTLLQDARSKPRN